MEKTPAAKKRRKRGALDDTPRYAAHTMGGGSGVAKRMTRHARKINDYGRRRKKAKKAIAARWPRYGTALLLARFCLDVVAGALKRLCHEGFRHRERKNAN
jgi:hypothetical protein